MAITTRIINEYESNTATISNRQYGIGWDHAIIYCAALSITGIYKLIMQTKGYKKQQRATKRLKSVSKIDEQILTEFKASNQVEGLEDWTITHPGTQYNQTKTRLSKHKIPRSNTEKNSK